MRGLAGIAAAVLALPACETAAAAGEAPLPPVIGTGERIVADWRSALALGGNDPVGYLLENAARTGEPRFETAWSGVVWRFVSVANQIAFVSDPASFAPRLGGYDALMAARGVPVAPDPAIFRIREGRLYLFRSEANRRLFDADPTAASRAETAWIRLRDGLAQD